MTVPALSLIQPWASLVASRLKFVETRSWKTDYRGKLAIHASASKVARDAAPALARICREAFGPDWPMILPRGKVLAICDLVDCANAAEIAAQVTAQERACGDFTPGRWALMLDRIERLPEPIAARGALGLWEWDEGGTGAVRAPAQGRLI